MPARVIHIAGLDSSFAIAQSHDRIKTTLIGSFEPNTEGEPYATRRAASNKVRRLMREGRISWFARIRFEGTAPEMKALPADVPELGQVVYGVDPEKREIFEAPIAYLRYQYGQLIVGYDPGNSESSYVRIRKWWPTRQAAEDHAGRTQGVPHAFVSKEELARRADAEIDQIWADAAKRIKSPDTVG